MAPENSYQEGNGVAQLNELSNTIKRDLLIYKINNLVEFLRKQRSERGSIINDREAPYAQADDSETSSDSEDEIASGQISFPTPKCFCCRKISYIEIGIVDPELSPSDSAQIILLVPEWMEQIDEVKISLQMQIELYSLEDTCVLTEE
jgi:hypothetical protein